MSIVNEFLDVFREEFTRLPTKREIDFRINLDPNTKQISIPPYRMVPAKFKEMKLQLEDLLYKGFI